MATTPSNPNINMLPMSSTNIVAAGYDAPTQTLRVEFSGGGIYEHYGVPEMHWQGLRSSFSAGKYYAAHLKGRFNYVRVN